MKSAEVPFTCLIFGWYTKMQDKTYPWLPVVYTSYTTAFFFYNDNDKSAFANSLKVFEEANLTANFRQQTDH